MKPARVAIAILAIALVIGVIAVISYQTNDTMTITHTEEFTTTSTSLITITSVVNKTTTTAISILGNVELTGNCTAVGVFIPDTSSAGVNQTQTYGNTTYSTTTYVNSTGWYVIRTTTYDSQDLPSERYTVTACTFGEDY